MAEKLYLKWGNLKGWNLETDASKAALRVYVDSGKAASSAQAMEWLSQPERDALCALIDAVDGPIVNDWSGETMTKEAAKKYVLEYGVKN